MNRHVETWVAFISGVIGGGLKLLQIGFTTNYLDSLWKAGLAAMFCGVMGVAGKRIGAWIVKQITTKYKNLNADIMSFFSEAWNRINASTPTFFKKVGRVGIGLSATGGSLLLPNLMPQVHIPAGMITAGSHLLIVGAVMKAVASFAVSNTDDIKKPEDPKP